MKRQDPPSGRLYVVATPIGNPDDITLRALAVLAAVDMVAAEDTRQTGLLLAAHNIKKPLVSCHEHNEDRRAGQLVEKLLSGVSIALVSDAGMPLVSDPGFVLVAAALEKGIDVVPIPGVSAVTTALSVAGLPTDSFTFVGFAAKKAAKRRRQLEQLAHERRTLVFLASPRTLVVLLTDIGDILGNRRAVVAREMTKAHEEFLRGDVAAIAAALAQRPVVKGECTLVLEGAAGTKTGPMTGAALQDLETAMADGARPLGELVRQVAGAHNLARRQVYAAALAIKKKDPLPHPD